VKSHSTSNYESRVEPLLPEEDAIAQAVHAAAQQTAARTAEAAITAPTKAPSCC
jgi:hypothetical protein